MKAKQVLQLLNVSRVTLCTYVKKEYIKVIKMPNGTYDYNEDSVYEFIGKKKDRVNVIYARVSTYKQKDDLKRQVNKLQCHCNQNNIDINKIYQEIASGINFERKEFKIILQKSYLESKKYSIVIPTKVGIYFVLRILDSRFRGNNKCKIHK